MEKEVKRLLSIIGENVIRGKIIVIDKKHDPETKQTICTIPGEDKRLVLDPDGAINFFDAVNGPVNHKLDEWHEFIDWIEGLDYSDLITENN